MKFSAFIVFSLCTLLSLSSTQAQDMPRKDVIEIPAIDTGLWVSNTFQSNMVLQRDKPIHLWGWADPGEVVSVTFAGKNTTATAARFETGKDNRGRMQYDSKRLVLTSIMVPQPIHFRYASGRNPLANLQAESNKDLPFPTQRSDDWPLHTVPLGILPEDLKPPYQPADLQKLRLALRVMDKQRRLAEARKVIEELEQQ